MKKFENLTKITKEIGSKNPLQKKKFLMNLKDTTIRY